MNLESQGNHSGIYRPGMPGIASPYIYAPSVGLVDILDCKDVDPEQVFLHCRKVLETMMKAAPRNGTQKSASMILCRKTDPILSMPPDALYEMLPVLFDDPLKAMKFLRMYTFMQDSGLRYYVSTDFNDAVETVQKFPDIGAIASLKLYHPSKWFINLPQEERLRKLLQKGVIEDTLGEYIEPMLDRVKECDEKPKVVIYGPNDSIKYTNQYDSLRAAMLEERAFRTVEKMFGKHPAIELRRDKHMKNVVQLLVGYCSN